MITRQNLLSSAGSCFLLTGCSDEIYKSIANTTNTTANQLQNLMQRQNVTSVWYNGMQYSVDGSIRHISRSPMGNCTNPLLVGKLNPQDDCPAQSDNDDLPVIASVTVYTNFSTAYSVVSTGSPVGFPPATGPMYSFGKKLGACFHEEIAAAFAGWAAIEHIAANAANYSAAIVSAANSAISRYGGIADSENNPAFITGAFAFLVGLAAELGPGEFLILAAIIGFTAYEVFDVASCLSSGG